METLKKASHWMLLSWVILFSACSTTDPKDLLVGEYAEKAGEESVFVVEKKDEKYFCKMYMSDHWSDLIPMNDIPDEEFESAFGKEWKNIVEAGMSFDQFGALLKIKDNATNDEGEPFSSTGYVLMPFGEIVKVK